MHYVSEKLKTKPKATPRIVMQLMTAAERLIRNLEREQKIYTSTSIPAARHFRSQSHVFNITTVLYQTLITPSSRF